MRTAETGTTRVVALALVVALAGCSGAERPDSSAPPSAPTSDFAPLEAVWTRALWLSGTDLVGDDSWLAVTDHTAGAGRGGSVHVPGELRRFDAGTGRQLWARQPLPQHWTCARSPSYGAEGPLGFLHAAGDDGDCTWLAGVDSRDGEVRWRHRLPEPADLVHTAHTVVVAGLQGSLGTPDEVFACVDRATGRTVPSSGEACESAVADVVGPELARADGTSVAPNDFIELAHHEDVRIGWLSTLGEHVLLAFDATTGTELWKRGRMNGETVFADRRGVVRAVPDRPLHELAPGEPVGLTLSRVNPRTWETLADLGRLTDAQHADQVGGLSVFVTDVERGPGATLSAYDLP